MARTRKTKQGGRKRPSPPPSPKALPEGAGDSRGLLVLLLPLLVILAGALAYYNSFDGAFVLDDNPHIRKSELIRHLGDRLGDILSTRRPLVTLSLAINYAISELKPPSYHAFNLVVHLLAGMALFGVVRRTLLTERLRKAHGSAASWFALVVSLIWVVHPLQTQSVTYIIQRGESMMGLFYLVTLYCVIRGAASSRHVAWYALAVLSLAMSLGSKGVAITAPIMVLAYDRVFLAAAWRTLLGRRWGLYLGLMGTWIIPIAVGLARGILSTSLRGRVNMGFSLKGITPAAYLQSQAGVLVHYLSLAVWPDALCLDYGWPIARTATDIVLPGIFILLLLGATGWSLIRKPWLGFVGLWFFIILAPTSSFIPIKDVAFEHRMYLPLAAVIVLVVAAAYAGLNWMAARFAVSPTKQAAITGALALVVIAALGCRTLVRNRDYASRLVMYQDVVNKRPGNSRGQFNLGNAWSRNGEQQKAIACLLKAIEIKPDHADALCNLGRRLDQTDRPDEAIEQYRKVLTFNKRHFVALYNLGTVLLNRGENDEAVELLGRAVRVKRRHVKSRSNYGVALMRVGRLDEAIIQYRRALKINPKHLIAWISLGDALQRQGQNDEAANAFRSVLKMDDDNAAAIRGLHRLGLTP